MCLPKGFVGAVGGTGAGGAPEDERWLATAASPEVIRPSSWAPASYVLPTLDLKCRPKGAEGWFFALQATADGVAQWTHSAPEALQQRFHLLNPESEMHRCVAFRSLTQAQPHYYVQALPPPVVVHIMQAPAPAAVAAPVREITAAPATDAEAAPPGGRVATVHALVIGIDAYTDPMPGKLANAVSDARAVHAALSQLPGAQVTLLTDCTKAEFDKGLNTFRDGVSASQATETMRGMRVSAAPKPAKNNTVLGLIFFAGHGLQVSGQNYLVPADFQPPRQNDNLDVMLRDTARACVPLSELEVTLVHAGVFSSAVLLDCCRNVPDFLAVLGATRSLGNRALPTGMADAKPSADNMMLAFATAPGACAKDRSSRLPQHSPFTAALLLALEQPRRLNDLPMFLVDAVRSDTGEEQRPQHVVTFGTEAGTLMLGKVQ